MGWAIRYDLIEFNTLHVICLRVGFANLFFPSPLCLTLRVLLIKELWSCLFALDVLTYFVLKILKDYLHPVCCGINFAHRLEWVNHIHSAPHMKTLLAKGVDPVDYSDKLLIKSFLFTSNFAFGLEQLLEQSKADSEQSSMLSQKIAPEIVIEDSPPKQPVHIHFNVDNEDEGNECITVMDTNTSGDKVDDSIEKVNDCEEYVLVDESGSESSTASSDVEILEQDEISSPQSGQQSGNSPSFVDAQKFCSKANIECEEQMKDSVANNLLVAKETIDYVLSAIEKF